MSVGITRLALSRLLKRRARQRSAAATRARDLRVASSSTPLTRRVVVPTALRICVEGGVQRVLRASQRRGYVTFDEVNAILPAGELSCYQIEAMVDAFHGLGIVIET
jgi:hypothetical protein